MTLPHRSGFFFIALPFLAFFCLCGFAAAGDEDLPPDLPPEILARMKERLDLPPHYTRQSAPLPAASSLTAGLAWLAAQQAPSGKLPAGEAYPGYPERFDVAVTALGGLAFLLDADFEAAAERALAYVLSCAHDDGYLYDGKPSFKGMWEHGFGTLFLAEMLLHKKARHEDAPKLEAALARAVLLIERVQNLDGGWGYRALPDPHAEVGPDAAMLDALRLALQAGIPLEEDTLRRGLQSQVALMLPPRPQTFQGEWRSFSYEANAFVLASLLAWKERPETNVYLEALDRVDPAAYFQSYRETTPMNGVYWATGHHTLGLLYTALALGRLGAAHEDTFAGWHADVAARLAAVQREDGAFKGWFGDAYGTALACLVLGARTGRLAWFCAPPGASPQTPAAPSAKGADAPPLDPARALEVHASLAPSRTRHAWRGFDATIERVGLGEGKEVLDATALDALLEGGDPTTVGSRWRVPEETVAILFRPFHKTVRGVVACTVLEREGTTAIVGLRALVKCGAEADDHVLTTSLSGTMRIDLAAKRITTLDLDTIAGCIRVRQARSGRTSSYVSLCDLALSLHGRDVSAEDIPANVPTGLLAKTFRIEERPGSTREEIHLGLRPLPGTPAVRPFWLYVPEGCDAEPPPALVVVFHRRGRLGSYREGQAFTEADLERYARKDLDLWRALADEHHFLLALPLGDVDILQLGVSWQTREHVELLDALLETVTETHAYDPTRVALVAQGEGAYAALATALRRGERVAAVALANPPLFDGEARIPWGKEGKDRLILPTPVPLLLDEATSARRVPIFLLAGTADEALHLEGHRNLGVPGVARYQDTSKIPAAHLRRMADLLEASGHDVHFEEMEGNHRSAFPAARREAAWCWLDTHRLP